MKQLLWFLLIFLAAIRTNAKTKCTTSDGAPGTCVEVSQCLSSLARMSGKFVTEDEKLNVKKNECSLETQVCCEDSSPNVKSSKSEQIIIEDTLKSLPERNVCGKNPDRDRIVGGEEAAIDEYPWMALIEYQTASGRISVGCGGSLISQRYVLSAAHCVKGAVLRIVGKPINIRLGEHDRSNQGCDCVDLPNGEKDCNDELVVIKIQKIVAHQGYGGSAGPRDDIALIRMEANAPFTDFIVPICLPISDICSGLRNKGMNFTTAGWGLTEAGYSDVKLFVKLPYTDLSSCEGYYQQVHNNTLWDKQMCAGGDKGKDSCKGDSGGPLMHKFSKDQYEVIGIVSFGPERCGTENVPGIYTKVYKYLDWISQNLEP